MQVPKLQKQARQELFKRHIQRDELKVVLNGKEYNVRKTQPSMKRIMAASGLEYTLDCEMLISIENDDEAPKGLQIIKESDSGKTYRILNVSFDFGTNCYLLQLGHKA
jgi:hypothetical protein